MDGAFLNLVRGNRLKAWMGLTMDDDTTPVKYGPGYHYVEIPVREALLNGEPVVDGKISRNQHIQIVAACRVKVRGNSTLMVVYSNELQRVANLGSFELVHPGGEEFSPSFYATFRKDFEVKDLTWAVRLYLLT